jgi:hypothetical protein
LEVIGCGMTCPFWGQSTWMPGARSQCIHVCCSSETTPLRSEPALRCSPLDPPRIHPQTHAKHRWRPYSRRLSPHRLQSSIRKHPTGFNNDGVSPAIYSCSTSTVTAAAATTTTTWSSPTPSNTTTTAVAASPLELARKPALPSHSWEQLAGSHNVPSSRRWLPPPPAWRYGCRDFV